MRVLIRKLPFSGIAGQVLLLTVLAFFGWWKKRQPSTATSLNLNRGLNAAVIILLFLGGHLGGNLTPGPDYLLEYAPGFVQKMLGGESKPEAALPALNHPDSSYLYANMVLPILERKCMSCHNDEVQRGGLNMATPELLQVGGDGGAVLVAGNALESELFRRVTLPFSSAKFMPPKGDPMTYDEIKIMEWWLQQDASFEKRVSDTEVTTI